MQTLAQPDKIRQDIRERRFVEHALQLAIQAALDIASHIVSDERLGEPRTNRELFDLLERNGWSRPIWRKPSGTWLGFATSSSTGTTPLISLSSKTCYTAASATCLHSSP